MSGLLDCVVVGAGPAGLSAGLYLHRYRRQVLLVDHGHSRALGIASTRNFPGFPDGIAGHELLARMRRQLAAVQGAVRHSEATGLERAADGTFRLQLGPQVVGARTVLLATGVVDVVPTLPGIQDVQRRGLLRQCPICDGYEHGDLRIAVLGDGTHAQRELRFITQYSARSVGVGVAAVPGPVAGATTLAAPAVRVELADAAVRLHLRDGSTHDCDVLYAAMGVRPRVSLAAALQPEVNVLGNLLVDAACRTNVPGLYAAGDVVGGLDQLTVAVGHGAVAATAIHNSLPLQVRAPLAPVDPPGAVPGTVPAR